MKTKYSSFDDAKLKADKMATKTGRRYCITKSFPFYYVCEAENTTYFNAEYYTY